MSQARLAMPRNDRPTPGERFSVYRIVRPLGVGGMATVYEASHAVLGKRVAVKVLHEHLAQNRVAAERFVREGRAAAAIRHPNVVEVFEVGTHSGTPFLVMELLEGQDLAAHLRAHGPLSGTEAVDTLLPAISAVAAAHAARVIHRDLKPRNIFLAREGRSAVRPKLLDFGISKVPDEKDRLTETDSLLGTLDYMAPELARSSKNASEASDQYALGLILYECVTGRTPFAGNSTYELLHAIVTAPFASPRAMGSPIDAGLEAVILRAMNRDPAKRFPSVQFLGDALLAFASEGSRGRWRGEFEEAPAPRETSETAIALCSSITGREASGRPLSADVTLREDGVEPRAPTQKGMPKAVIAAALALSVGIATVPTVLRTRAAPAPRPRREEPSSAPSERIPSAYSGAGAPQNEPPALAQRAGLATPRLPATPPPSPTRALAARRMSNPPMPASASAQTRQIVAAPAPVAPAVPAASVDRGYNGAPIVE